MCATINLFWLLQLFRERTDGRKGQDAWRMRPPYRSPVYQPHRPEYPVCELLSSFPTQFKMCFCSSIESHRGTRGMQLHEHIRLEVRCGIHWTICRHTSHTSTCLGSTGQMIYLMTLYGDGMLIIAAQGDRTRRDQVPPGKREWRCLALYLRHIYGPQPRHIFYPQEHGHWLPYDLDQEAGYLSMEKDSSVHVSHW
jgi:hypothetical protein